MEKGIALSNIQELLEEVQAIADMLIMIGMIDEGEVEIKPATVGTLGKMINHYVIQIFEALEEHLNGS
jgi:hypothetical protein